jgi:hypothetical protein
MCLNVNMTETNLVIRGLLFYIVIHTYIISFFRFAVLPFHIILLSHDNYFFPSKNKNFVK